MTPHEREALEVQAARCRRRGELARALGAYQAILQAFPDDRQAEARVRELSQMLQPLELSHPKANPTPSPFRAPLTLEERAERCAAHGDYLHAAVLYRRALRERPRNELLAERLGQLVALARQQGHEARPSRPAVPAQETRLHSLLERLSARRRAP